MNTKNNKKAKNSIEKIKISIGKFLKEKNYSELNIKNVCASANVNRTTFYAHFESIDDALYHICEDHIIKVYKLFANTNLDYKERIRKAISVVRDNIDFFSYLFSHSQDLELKILEIAASNYFVFDNNQDLEKSKLSLTFIVSGLIGIAKMYLHDITQNKSFIIPTEDFVDLVFNLINKNNPYFVIK